MTLTPNNTTTNDVALKADRKAQRRLRDYNEWKRRPRDPIAPEDSGREGEFAWGEAWDLGYAARTPSPASLDDFSEAQIMRLTAWLYAREGGVAFDQLSDEDQEHWRFSAIRAVAAMFSKPHSTDGDNHDR